MATNFGPNDKLVRTNLNMVFWPEHGYTKGDLLDYYRTIAPVMLTYLIDRPQVLHRHVDGHTGKEFFQRVSRTTPLWLKTTEITLEDGRKRDFYLCRSTFARCSNSRVPRSMPGMQKTNQDNAL